ncbi:branched-chain-amino-acid aminotransferase-like protein 2 [Dorcoceras hygrometricum]|uniref:Branched-chain-amino-acid aminotransferase-like protein 2 n=1 Tax=Dorcoceras hygrometricum TaxID=472368 RepID=A0A2Z7ALQ2_9LAMI|nr:branched-chain-amino-acid aminotransferase-like protein 2 [Dorcoceras hygrometricum]
MASSLFVNTLQVEFESVLAMEHTGMTFKADLGESVKLHPQKMLTSKSVQTYIKKNLEIKPAGESRKHTEDTASNTEGGDTQNVEKKNKKRVKKVLVGQRPVEAASNNAPATSKSGINSDDDPLEQLCKEGGIFAPIQIQEIIWVTHFLPKIAPSNKGKGKLEEVARPNPIEEHCQIVLYSAWDDELREIVRNVENVDGTETDSEQGQLDPNEQHLDQGHEHQVEAPIHNKSFRLKKKTSPLLGILNGPWSARLLRTRKSLKCIQVLVLLGVSLPTMRTG